MQIIFRDIIPMLIPIITINAIFIAVGGVVAQAGLAFMVIIGINIGIMSRNIICIPDSPESLDARTYCLSFSVRV